MTLDAEELEAVCVLIEQAERLGIYGGTPAFDAYMTIPKAIVDRLAERRNAKTERILSQAEECKGHKHSPTGGGEVCPFCGRFRSLNVSAQKAAQ